MGLDGLTQPADTSVFFRREDINDIRLGEVVLTSPEFLPQADIVIVGCPQDDGVARNKGRVGARLAPDAIRRCFYRMAAFENPTTRLFDAGNTLIQDSLEATHAHHQTVIETLLSLGKTVISLGGGNDLAYPDCAALGQYARQQGQPLIGFNIDAHFDVRADTIRNSGTPYRQLLTENILSPSYFYEIGYQPFGNSPVYKAFLRDLGVHHLSLMEVQQKGIEMILSEILTHHAPEGFIFWGVDMDVVRAADAPGVSALNPTGLSGAEFCTVAAIAGGDLRSRIFEITEVNPTYDIDERTCRLAAAAIYHFILARFPSS
jgi:formiminoglutamase